ncbi:MAG TPA: UPF0280 family protein [Anaerolineae bacterium]|nr:UPF0280 family protein [Anaerolineae bacterium]
MYEPRFYRNQTLAKDLYSFEVRIKETDLFISADRDLKAVAHELVYFYRGLVEEFIGRFPLFKETLVPIEVPKDAPDIVKSMADAAKLAGVGPMAAVAGAIAEYVGRGLLEYSDEVIVENGGDIFIKTERDRKMGIYASESPLSNRIAITITPNDTPLGICTSSGTVGHSLSFGKADAVVILSGSTSLADATATKVGNIIHSKDDIRKAIEFAQSVPGIEGAIIVVGDGLGGWGKFEFIPA